MPVVKIIDTHMDNVIKGLVAIGYVSYEYALDQLVPLINKTDFQRKLQDKKFYEKLERDIEDGCVMPPITIAFIETSINEQSQNQQISSFINDNINKSFVLDGIQRLNTISRLLNSSKLNKKRKLYVNFIFCDSTDKLLYRMITLNNGQRPMTPRHQVEMMLKNAFDFEDYQIHVQTEKERAKKIDRKSFNMSDIIQAYLAFMADSPIIDNKKIIQEKMDSLLVGKIISTDPLKYESKFSDIIRLIERFQDNPNILRWLKITNNLVGFTVGIKNTYMTIKNLTIKEFENSINTFEDAFKIFNPSKIKVGKMRRELSCEYFKNFPKLKDFDSDELSEYFIDLTNE